MKIYQVDAFTNKQFKGNPAAVCMLPGEAFPESQWMQSLAAEMNLSETAFLLKTGGDDYQLKWFTPTIEVELCGHATLATAHILWEEGLLPKNKHALFETLSGRLDVSLKGGLMMMNFPMNDVKRCKAPIGLDMALDCTILGTYSAGRDLLVEIENEKVLKGLSPSLQQLSVISARCIVVTAKGDDVDFVSRVFCPTCGIDEDPVTGSTHCSLAPFWAERLGKNKMNAVQLSARGGQLSVELVGDRVNIAGQAITVFKGVLV